MAHLAGIYTQDEHAPDAGELWTLLTKRFGAPFASASEGPFRAAVFAQHPGERIVAPQVEGEPAGKSLGFGGSDVPVAPERLVPPWMVCQYDPAQRTAVVRTDRHGFALVYFRCIGGVAAFSTCAAALGRLPPALKADRTAWAEMLAFDHLLGERTMRSGVSAIPQGCDLRIAPSGITFPRRFRYSDIALSTKLARRPAALSLIPLWREAIAFALDQRGEDAIVSVPLSGGLDSRLLAAAAKEAGARVEAFTFGRQDIPDEQVPDVAIAREVSRVLDIPWRFLPLEDDWLATHALRAAELADGQIDVVHSYGISVIDAFTPGRLRLDGLAGDVVLGGSFLKKEWLRASTPEECVEAFWRARARIRSPAWQELLLEEARSEILARARSSLSDSLALELESASSKPDPRWSDFWILRHRIRRFTRNGSLLWAAVCRSVFPFFVPGFIDRLLALPPTMRLDAALQSAFLQDGWPHMASIPWQKTGRAVPRGTLWESLARRIRKSAFPPRGPFYDFNTAFRRSARLRDFMKDTLLDPSSGVQRFGCFDRAAVEKLLRDTGSGARPGMAQLGLLVSLVLAEKVWSSRP